MLALSDSQLRAIWAAADGLLVKKRGVFLGRLVAQLLLRGSRFHRRPRRRGALGAEGPDPTVGCLKVMVKGR